MFLTSAALLVITISPIDDNKLTTRAFICEDKNKKQLPVQTVVGIRIHYDGAWSLTLRSPGSS